MRYFSDTVKVDV